jgi:hypothetical protein
LRRTLGLLAGMVTLCATSWAQVPPTDNPPPPPPAFPRFELFGGYAYGRTDLFNSGDTARLNGFNASLGVNVAKWLGFVFAANGLYGNSQIPVAVPTPFPTCPPFCPPSLSTFNVDTKMYNYFGGAQFPYRKFKSWTPFGELLFGHSGVRGESRSDGGALFAEASGGFGFLAGVGADFPINRNRRHETGYSPRYALRIKADYVQSRAFKQKQDSVVFSVGVVFRSVPRKKRKTLEDVNPPAQ